jgi:transcriptional regulator with XRE-family HTH domain
LRFRVEAKQYGGSFVIRVRLKEIAQEQGLNQAQISRRTDIDLKTIRELWRNPERIVTTETLNKLANGLHVGLDVLLEYSPDPQ